MKEINKNDLPQDIYDLYDDYAHNRLDRRQFMDRLATYAVGGLTVASLMSFMLPDYKTTATVNPKDPDIKSDYATYESPKGGGTIKGLLSMPSKGKKFPGVVVVHENRGLNPYIEDVGRRCAKAGFISIAPDALSPLGGYPGNDDEGRELQRKRNRDEMLEDFIAAYTYLLGHKNCNGNIGVVGFCFGGWISNIMAVKLEGLKASVPFYGGQPSAEDVASIKAPLCIHYAGLDTRVNEGWPAYEAALKENDKKYEVYFYPTVNHGFHNNTTPRFDEKAANLAWERTIEFFKKNLV